MKRYKGMIYKYRGLGQFTDDIIIKNQLWFSLPESLNDPFEVEVSFNIPHDEKILFKALKRLYSEKSRQELRRLISKTTFDENYERSLKSYMDKNSKNNIVVCSFTKRNNSIQMWSYYAKSHRGLCFGFDALQDSDSFFDPIEVIYAENNELINAYDAIANNFERHFIIFTKSKVWEHEDEVRIVRLLPEAGYSYTKKALRELIFGCNATSATIDHYSKLLQDHGYDHVKLKRAVKNDRYYKLDIVDL